MEFNKVCHNSGQLQIRKSNVYFHVVTPELEWLPTVSSQLKGPQMFAVNLMLY